MTTPTNAVREPHRRPNYRADVPRDVDATVGGGPAPGAEADHDAERALDEDFAAGKADALEAAYRRYGPVVHGYARRAAGPRRPTR